LRGGGRGKHLIILARRRNNHKQDKYKTSVEKVVRRRVKGKILRHGRGGAKGYKEELSSRRLIEMHGDEEKEINTP